WGRRLELVLPARAHRQTADPLGAGDQVPHGGLETRRSADLRLRCPEGAEGFRVATHDSDDRGSGHTLSMGARLRGDHQNGPRRMRVASKMKSLLISSIYFPPNVGGIAEIMAAVASALGPERVCCLTGVTANETAGRNHFRPTVYRRPAAFARAKSVQAVGCAIALTRIMVRDRPAIVQ